MSVTTTTETTSILAAAGTPRFHGAIQARRRSTGTVIIGAGQAGLALSRVLVRAGRDHVVLERGRIGERWRSERWESLALLTPAWASALPGQSVQRDRDSFLTRDTFVHGLEAYAAAFDAPVAEGVTVGEVSRSGDRFRVSTDRGSWSAGNVVVATGDCDVPRLPAAAATVPPGILTLPSSGYVAPERLPDGGVLVVGNGPTGQQLALELARAGRAVTLAVGRHTRMPRRYRGRDVWRWLEELGDLDVTIDEVHDPRAARRAPSLPLSGVNGGEDLDLGVLQRVGVAVTGRLEGFSGSSALFGNRLASDVADAERRMRRLLARIDDLAASATDVAPAETVPGIRVPRTVRELDLHASGVRTVLWATGYRRAYPWLRVPVLDAEGEIVQHHGVTAVPGLFTLGLKFQRRRRSHFIGGVGADAEVVATRIEERELLSRAAR
jgi:putative flavoprotein involved in K+ transport